MGSSHFAPGIVSEASALNHYTSWRSPSYRRSCLSAPPARWTLPRGGVWMAWRSSRLGWRAPARTSRSRGEAARSWHGSRGRAGRTRQRGPLTRGSTSPPGSSRRASARSCRRGCSASWRAPASPTTPSSTRRWPARTPCGGCSCRTTGRRPWPCTATRPTSGRPPSPSSGGTRAGPRWRATSASSRAPTAPSPARTSPRRRSRRPGASSCCWTSWTRATRTQA
mmetsp:Transcript_67782/g.191079  ORF Transcript_67782/g.191079 Transcript_67782/m.191079 type:complete len:224 (+) Transcript_67782:1-672(+)